jgi:DNA mismatch endonuclease (patch repair protein)
LARMPLTRSEVMRAVKSKDTKPEMTVRRMIHGMGYRYRLHRKDLPGKPDLVFPGRRKVIFVHGCFWHSHGCKSTRAPKSNLDYWLPKLERNRQRDSEKQEELKAAGWAALIIWECELGERDMLAARVRQFLG